MAGRSLIAVVTPAFGCAESVEALVHEVDGSGEVRLIAPAVATNSIEGAFGEIDEPRVDARDKVTGQARYVEDLPGVPGDPPAAVAAHVHLVFVDVALAQFTNSDQAPWNYMMATAIIYSLPPVATYYAFRHRMASGLTMGGVSI